MSGRVIYMAPEVAAEAGGVRMLSRHVSLLCEAGIDAALWCPAPGYRYTWFDEVVPMLSGTDLELTADDLLVVPEPAVLPGRDPAPGARKVIFNQNHFYTLLTWPDPSGYPGWTPTPTVWTASRESARVLTRLYPELPLHRVPYPIDTDLFRPGPRRTRSVAWMPRKRTQESTLLKRLLATTPGAEDVELRELTGLSEHEVAETLGRTSVFVALGAFEGFGLPVAEALSTGCLVVGYPAGGGLELFDAPGAWAVPDQRPLLLAEETVRVLDLPDTEGLRTASRQWVRDRHTAETVGPALVEAVRAARARPGAPARAVHFSAWMDEILAALGGLTGSADGRSPRSSRERSA
ncbi:glycosyltransferase [Micromonospora sp. NBC_01699]|uniref:glycosyltransferase n=1 Tax=Micromonospora sp. NBC_01699 TaxID=2975984 RepID=UPI002E2BF84F|nr:glycosyltransferase [Micromonospora sp. NBC_01699]